MPLQECAEVNTVFLSLVFAWMIVYARPVSQSSSGTVNQARGLFPASSDQVKRCVPVFLKLGECKARLNHREGKLVPETKIVMLGGLGSSGPLAQWE